MGRGPSPGHGLIATGLCEWLAGACMSVCCLTCVSCKWLLAVPFTRASGLVDPLKCRCEHCGQSLPYSCNLVAGACDHSHASLVGNCYITRVSVIVGGHGMSLVAGTCDTTRAHEPTPPTKSCPLSTLPPLQATKPERLGNRDIKTSKPKSDQNSLPFRYHFCLFVTFAYNLFSERHCVMP